MNLDNISSYSWCICVLIDLPVIPDFLVLFSHSLIPSTARLRINYISIDGPLGRGIDIHGPLSAPRPMCIPQHRSPALCITPGLHYLLYSLRHRVANACLEKQRSSPRSSHGSSVCHSADPNVGTDCAHEHPENFNCAKCRV